MNIVFFANGPFALPSLDILNKNSNNYKIKAVVTNEDKRSGRGQKLNQTLIAKFSKQKLLNVFKIKKFSDKTFIDKLKSLDADLFIVISYRILPEYIYNIPKLGSINIHASVLPEYRGAAPIQRSIIDGKKYLGLTSFFLNENIDEGNIILTKKIPIDDLITYGESFDNLSNIAPLFLIETLNSILENKQLKVQSNKKATYANKINKEEYAVNLDKSSKNVHNKIRGLTPPGCYLFLNNKKVKLYNTYYNSSTLPFGCYKIEENTLLIGCKSGCLEVKKIQFEGKKIINVKDFKNMNLDKNIPFKSKK